MLGVCTALLSRPAGMWPALQSHFLLRCRRQRAAHGRGAHGQRAPRAPRLCERGRRVSPWCCRVLRPADLRCPVCVCSQSLPEHAAFTSNSGTPAQYFFGHILSAMGMYTLLFTATATLGLRIWAYLVGDWPLCNRVQRPSNASLPLRVVDVAGGQKLVVLSRLFTRHPCEW